MTQRTNRIDELIRQEIGEIIARDLSDPRIGFVTITDVETTPDLSHAKVWVSFIGTADEQTVAMAALGRAMPFIRRELGKRLRIRRIPELHLQADETLVRGTRVLQLINDLREGALIAGAPAQNSLPTPVARLPHDGDAPVDAPAPAFQASQPTRKGKRPPGKTGDASKPRRGARDHPSRGRQPARRRGEGS